MPHNSRTDRTREFGRVATRDILERGREEACMAEEAANVVPQRHWLSGQLAEQDQVHGSEPSCERVSS